MADKLDILVGKESCPVCGSISQKGTARCPECGTFHSGIHLEDREPPAPEERVAERSFDPSDYSINPLASITDEEFEGDETSVKSWSGGSTDFKFDGSDDEIKVQKQEIIVPDSEEIESN